MPFTPKLTKQVPENNSVPFYSIMASRYTDAADFGERLNRSPKSVANKRSALASFKLTQNFEHPRRIVKKLNHLRDH